VDAPTPDDLEPLRRPLTGYCYRLLGSGSEAEDAVQETMLKAWRNLERFEGRSSLKSWVYRIATNVCLDMLQGPQRRARPMDLHGPSTGDTLLGPPLLESAWIQPVPDAKVVSEFADPAEIAAERETLRLAFVSALQHLPPRQRAVLVLREVLRWPAADVADLLDTTVASVNSALQRARATVADLDPEAARPTALDDDQQQMLADFMTAFEAYDIERIVAMLRDDVVFSMPPFEMWVRGTAEVAAFLVGQGAGCRGSRLVPVAVNGGTGFATYKPDGDGFTPWSIQTFELDAAGRIAGWHHFLGLDPALFPLFGLPPRLDR
jgi:RNA polymerase sigma-70 factor (ECF subfamily)